jgi:methionyl-tRNA synthetase
MSKFFVTTPIYYVNDVPHLGHAYTTVAADILTRYARMKGEQAFFLTGTDEHGAKIAQAAQKAKKTPKEFCDEKTARFQLAWEMLNISYNNFIRTTNKDHEAAVQKAAQKLYEKGLIVKGTYEGLYCVGCERYYTEKELVDGKCPEHQKPPEKYSEDCYLFKLSAFQKPLLQLIQDKTLVIEPKEKRNEIVSFLTKEKLEDISISRKNVTWGVPLPWDKSQTLYVWFDAFLNYLTGIGWDGREIAVHNKEEGIYKWWPVNVQLMAKDILRVHATIWPAMLLALEIPLPKKIFAHGFFTINGQKMSKSLGNVLDPVEQAKIFSSDGLRWLLISSFPFGTDGDISEERFYEKYNAELANGIGNLVARTLTLATKFTTNYKSNTNIQITNNFRNKTEKVWQEYEKQLENLEFESVTKQINSYVAYWDKYINENEPWKLVESNLDKFNKIIYNVIEGLRQLAWLIMPFMPETADKIFENLGILDDEKKKNLKQAQKWGSVEFNKIEKSAVLFPRIEK